MAFSRRTTASVSSWITRRSALAAAFAILIAVPGPRPGFAAGATGAPMTNEDVVKMVIRHVPTDEILEAIRRARSTAFDLDPEMVIELRRAGVPDAVLSAMSEARRAQPPPATEIPEASGVIELVFTKDEGGSVPKSTAVAPAKDWNDRPVSLAFFIYCSDPLHAPDLWETKTPLAPPFPRHHLIWFHEATRPWRGDRRGGMVSLDLPDRTSIEASAGTHSLELGVAARAGAQGWTPLGRTETTVQVKPGTASRLVLRVRSRRAGRLGIAWGGTPWVTVEIAGTLPPEAPAGGADPKAPPPPPPP